jgi:hypothetical protein
VKGKDKTSPELHLLPRITDPLRHYSLVGLVYIQLSFNLSSIQRLEENGEEWQSAQPQQRLD